MMQCNLCMELKMIELRWLIRQGCDGPEKVLQTRQQYEATIYSSVTSTGNYLREMKWSEWADVPRVEA